MKLVGDTYSIKSYAKINLWLSVLGRRPDGFHEVRTVLQTIDLHDELSAAPAGPGALICHCRHPAVPSGEANLVVQAGRALQKAAGIDKGATFHLVKRIPVGGGLGGGSSNAAMALILLDRLWGLGLGTEGLLETAAALGSDVPFFLKGGLCLGIGRGEEVYPLEEGDPYWVVLAGDGVQLSTRQVYERAGKLLTTTSAGAKIRRLGRFFSAARGCGVSGLENDLEQAASAIDPGILRIKALLERQGSRAVMLSGSGSSVFALFEQQRRAADALDLLRHKGYESFLCSFLNRAAYGKAISGFDMLSQPHDRER